MITNAFLLVFVVAFMGCVLSTPMIPRVAAWAGAIDRPDQFRRIHKGATPRMGGLGLAIGLGAGLLPVALGGLARDWPGATEWWARQWSVVVAAMIVIAVGAYDDSRGIRPRFKLLGQALAVFVLILGGIKITKLTLLGMPINFSFPLSATIAGRAFVIDPLSSFVTLVWFLACMNIWNLIDGMDGLASGVGLLVSATLMLVAIFQNNIGSALLAAALAGSLAGFLLYNWHPAVIFLGDTGSLLIGLLLGVIGVQDSLKGTVGVSILFPILAMGLPISDTAMAIFRRWVRNLPLSAADRRHIHHLLIGLGLRPPQAAILLYCFSGFLCGAVLLGVALGNEFLALILGLFGCAAFLLVLTSRRDELSNLWNDFRGRSLRKRQERQAAKVTWESIQRIELCEHTEKIREILVETGRALGCDALRISCYREGRTVFQFVDGIEDRPGETIGAVSGATATFRLSSGRDLLLAVVAHQAIDSVLAADIAFRFLQRLALATAERLERLLNAPLESVSESAEDDSNAPESLDAVVPAVKAAANAASSATGVLDTWFRRLGWGAAGLGRAARFGDE